MSHLQALLSQFSVHSHCNWILILGFILPFWKRKKFYCCKFSGCPVGKIMKKYSRMRQNPVSRVSHIPLNWHTQG